LILPTLESKTENIVFLKENWRRKTQREARKSGASFRIKKRRGELVFPARIDIFNIIAWIFPWHIFQPSL